MYLNVEITDRHDDGAQPQKMAITDCGNAGLEVSIEMRADGGYDVAYHNPSVHDEKLYTPLAEAHVPEPQASPRREGW